jgi:hypothetical protein
VIILHMSVEGRWAGRGFVYGLVAVTAYDAVRIPMVIAGIWPDFIPRLGGWIIGHGDANVLVGYTWRYLGDGGGIGLAFFAVCGLIGVWKYPALAQRPIQLGVGYGVFIWSGLIATVALTSHGSEMLFPLTPLSLGLSLLGHLIYGSVLGIGLRRGIQAEASFATEQENVLRTVPRVPAVSAAEAPTGSVLRLRDVVPAAPGTLPAGDHPPLGATVGTPGWQGIGSRRGASAAGTAGALTIIGAAALLRWTRSRQGVTPLALALRAAQYAGTEAQHLPPGQAAAPARGSLGHVSPEAFRYAVAAALDVVTHWYASSLAEDRPGTVTTAGSLPG